MTAPTWGTPWHGILTEGQLTLPNATTRPYPGVVDNTAAPNLGAGRTHRVKRPDWIYPGRSPEGMAADVLAGKQWRGEAMLSGINQALYGQDLNGWLYFAPDGSRWLIDNPFNTTIDSIQIRLRLRPFGRRGAPPLWVERTLTVDPLQSPPLFVGPAAFTVGVRSDSLSTTEPSTGLLLWDVSSSGKRATFRLSLARTTFWPGDSAPPLAVGWLQVTVSGGDTTTPPSTELAVLYSREQTLGVAPAVEVSGLNVAELGVTYDTVEAPDDAPPPDVMATYPPGEGYTYVVRTTTAVPELGSGLTMPVKAAGASVFSGELAYKLEGRIFAVWYDEEENPQPVTLDMDWGTTVEDDHAAEPSGASVVKLVRNPGGTDGFQYSSTNTLEVNAEMVTLAVGYLECRLTHAGNVIATRSECRRTQRQNVSLTSAGWTYNPPTTSTQLVGEEYDFSGAGADTSATNIVLPSLQPLPVGMPTGGGIDVRFYAPWADWAGWRINEAGAVSQWGQRRESPPTATDLEGAFALRLIPLTPHIAGWITYGGPRSVGGAAWQVKHQPVLTPSGVDSRAYSTTYGSFGTSGWHLHASRDPMTGECARFYPRRVCYV